MWYAAKKNKLFSFFSRKSKNEIFLQNLTKLSFVENSCLEIKKESTQQVNILPFSNPAIDTTKFNNYTENAILIEDIKKYSGFTKLFGIIGFAIFGFLAINYKKLHNQSEKSNFREESSDSDSNHKLTRNILKNRVSTISYAANNPIEDRYNAIQLKNLDGYLIEVLDGHGGYQVAEYASKKLHLYLDQRLGETKHETKSTDEEKIISAINFAFSSVEKDFYQMVKDAFSKGFLKVAYVGACALLIIVHDNKLYVANCGDSKAKLFNFDGANYIPVKLTRTLNAGSKKEQMRLRSEYSDADIYVCKKKSSKACYVKGRLQPTWVFLIFNF